MKLPATSLLAVAISVVIAVPSPVHAAAPDQRDPDKPFYLDTVVVKGKRDKYGARNSRSATKMELPLRDTPQSIGVVTDQLIKDQDMDSLEDVVRYLPGVSMAQGEGNRDTVVMRGISSTADFFVDGIRDDTQYIRDVYNSERIESLKGANAMSFGRGAGGGLLNRVSKVADGAEHSAMSLTLGSHDRRRVTADLGTAFDERWSARLPWVWERSGTYRDHQSIQRFGWNPSVRFAPDDRNTITLATEIFQDRRIADRGVPSTNGRPLQTDASLYIGDPRNSPVQATVRSATLSWSHEWSPDASLRNVLKYADYDKFYQNVFASGYDAGTSTVTLGAYNNRTVRSNWFNQTDFSAEFATAAVKHRLLIGTEFGQQRTGNQRLSGVFLDSNRVELADPIYRGRLSWISAASDANNIGTARIAALYAQDMMEIHRNWTLLLGARHERFSMDFTDLRNGRALRNVTRQTSPRAALMYKPATRITIYASYGQSYLPRAGDQLSSLTLTSAALDPETFENRELGAKWELRPDLLLSAAIYQLDRGNVAVTDPLDASRSILVDGLRSQGAELSLAGRLTRKWNVIGAYALQEGEDLTTGLELSQLSKHSASIWNRYDFSRRFGAGLGVQYRSGYYAARDLSTWLPGYTRVDAALYFRPSAKLSVQFNVENLLDRNYWASAHSNMNITPGSPRSYALTLNYGF